MASLSFLTEIANGIQGKAYRAELNEQSGSKTECVVKVIECPDINYGNKLFNQLMKLSELDHKGVLVPHDVFLSWEESTSSVNVNIVYPLLNDPGSLEDVIKNYPLPTGLPISEIHEVVGQIISSLQYIKSCGMFHLNLKPSNVFVNSGSYVIADFGLPALMSDIATRTRTTDGILYKFTELEYLYRIVKEPCNLHRYHPPELKSTDGDTLYDSKADVYALGLLIYQMCFLDLEVPDNIDEWREHADGIEDEILRGLFLKATDPSYDSRPSIDQLG